MSAFSPTSGVLSAPCWWLYGELNKTDEDRDIFSVYPQLETLKRYESKKLLPPPKGMTVHGSSVTWHSCSCLPSLRVF